MNPKNPLLAVGLISFIVFSQSAFIVSEGQQALVLEFGKPRKEISDTGLKFKVPFLQQVEFFDKRILDVDPAPSRVILSNESSAQSADGKAINSLKDIGGEPIIVDTFVRYRITNPLKFRQSLNNERDAAVRLESVTNDTTRNILGNISLQDLLSEKRGILMNKIKEKLNNSFSGLGVEIVDVRIGRTDLTDNMEKSTFNRMISDFNKRATETRSEGKERALEISSKADKEKTIIISEAERDSELLRGAADRESTEIYSKSYGKDSEFYTFYRSLQAYRTALTGNDTVFVMSPDNGFLKSFKTGSKE